jgi:cytochrome c biogenesis protein CcmG, thiol:disulfide interchange protein DsbE
MARRLRLLGWGVALLVAIVLLAVFGLASNHSSTTGRPAPALPHEHLGGPPATLASLLSRAAGKPSLVVFWASWCGPCTKEAPALERFALSTQGRGRMVGVDWSDALSGARSFIHRYSWTFPNLRDAEGLVGNSYRLTGLPTTFVLDGHGRIKLALRGPQDGETLQRALAKVEHS